jgi:hypothetical protein
MAKVKLTLSVDMPYLADDTSSKDVLDNVANLWFGVYRDDLQDELIPVEVLSVSGLDGEVIYERTEISSIK